MVNRPYVHSPDSSIQLASPRVPTRTPLTASYAEIGVDQGTLRMPLASSCALSFDTKPTRSPALSKWSTADTVLPAFVNVARSDCVPSISHVNGRSSTAAGAITTISFMSVTVSARVSTGPPLSTIGKRPAIFT